MNFRGAHTSQTRVDESGRDWWCEAMKDINHDRTIGRAVPFLLFGLLLHQQEQCP